MDSQPFEVLRDAMVRMQIERRGVADARVLAALRAVPRERFVPAALQPEAYADRALSIGLGQTISQPYMVAVMTAALRLAPTDRVLEIGTGSGYQSAVLAELAGEVVSIERHAPLAEAARARLAALGVVRVTVVVGDGTQGYAPGAPYDAILVTAGAPRIPDALRSQLADGGRLVIPVGSAWHQDLLVVERAGTEFRTTAGEGCVFVPLVGRDGWPD
jgi:protein-L-isoaspartate(D-aspartate) O-methyltransferase